MDTGSVTDAVIREVEARGHTADRDVIHAWITRGVELSQARTGLTERQILAKLSPPLCAWHVIDVLGSCGPGGVPALEPAAVALPHCVPDSL